MRGTGHRLVRGCMAAPRCRRRKLPPDGWLPLAVAGGGIQSGVYS